MKDIRVLISEKQIADRVAEIGARITKDFAGQELVMVCVLKGSFMYFSDLVRHIKLPLTCEFLSVSSYGNAKTSSGEVKMVLDLGTPLDGKNVIVVEDIVDTGITLRFILDLLSVRNPKTLKTCTLLEKPEAIKADVKVDYVGFQIGNEFVVGYGLDYAQHHRELPYIGVVRF
ncbi:MAG: hypoxanthine phosphoribosyltransferase [Bdellovibrionales bacterium]|nr:hypoxanthine phosphoribosyltransferase [Bdellovibrionales bacterium]